MRDGASVRLFTNCRAVSSLQRSKTVPMFCSMAWLMAPSHCSRVKNWMTASAPSSPHHSLE